MNKNTSKYFTILFMAASILKGQDDTFIPAGKAAGYSKYNLITSTANGNDGAGGVSFVGESFGATTTYRVTASFDGGTSFNNIPSFILDLANFRFFFAKLNLKFFTFFIYFF